MKGKFLPVLFFFLIVSYFARAQQKDVADTLSGYFKTAQTEKIAHYLSSIIELSILGEGNSYSSAQAEVILRDFFTKNKPVAVKVINRLSSNPNYKLAVLSLQSDKDKFRISISLSSNAERFLITEIRIETDKPE
ncbi:MAG: DUF4783 domain-containing protein [Daejeonella sp.]